MSERLLRNLFIFGTLFFLLVLIAMTADSISQIVSARTPALTAEVVEGKRTWQQKNCNDCHTILGIGAYYAPELTKETTRRDPRWVSRYLLDPQGVKPGTTMPDQRLSEAQAANLVAFLEWVSRIDTNDWPPRPLVAPGGSGPAGALLFQQKGCADCHKVGGQGADEPGPDLSTVGRRPNAAADLAKWLADPEAQKPGTIMPKPELTSADRDALVAYLAGLR